jgi:hypothetical protein
VINGRARAVFVQEIRNLTVAFRDTVNNLLLWENLGFLGTVEVDAGHFSETSDVLKKRSDLKRSPCQ